MAKVISTLFISADGVAEIDPDWHFPYFDDNMGRAVGEDYDTSDVLLIGRVDRRPVLGPARGRAALPLPGPAAAQRGHLLDRGNEGALGQVRGLRDQGRAQLALQAERRRPALD